MGDAALATDPLFGVGLTFAFQSAEWLVDETSGALGGREDLDAALRRYRRKFAWRLAPHHLVIGEFSTGRPIRPFERRFFRTAAHDPTVARALGRVVTRERSPLYLFDPRLFARVLIARHDPDGLKEPDAGADPPSVETSEQVSYDGSHAHRHR